MRVTRATSSRLAPAARTSPISDELTVDSLTGGWTIVQRKKGHRHSTDDLLTGWYAIEVVAAPQRILDLGAGIGTVGLIALWRSPAAKLVSIEAQEVSFGLLEENVARNALRDRVRMIHGDLRDTRLADRFDLVTGSPPYWDISQGVVPADSQKAHARFELRGDVRDYCVAARAHLAPGGRFVFCFPTVQRARAEAAVAAANLSVTRSRDVIPRVGAEPLFTLFAARRTEDGDEPHVREPDHLVRDAAGEPTAMHRAARAALGFTDRAAT